MRVLVVEATSEGQASLATRLESIDRIDKDLLDLTVQLASDQNLSERIAGTDVVVLGAGLGDQAKVLARNIKSQYPAIEILMLVSERTYTSGAFRSSIGRGARKVLSEGAPLLDLVQELLTIHEEHRTHGRVRTGRVIAVVQAKGGVGATSTCAALAEVCSDYGQRTMLWDLDIETRDLCRALTVDGDQPSVVRGWIDGSRELSRDSLREALMTVSPTVSVLPPPDDISTCIDLVGQVDTIDLVQSILNLARVTHENVIVDVAGRLGPASAAILRSADTVVVMVDDSVLGLTAVRFFLSTLRSIVKNPESICFLCSGVSVSKEELATHIEREVRFGPSAWRLPTLPFDSAASRWAGSGGTLYSQGKKSTRNAFERVASGLDLIQFVEPEPVKLIPFLSSLGSKGDNAVRPSSLTEVKGTTSHEPSIHINPFRAIWHRVANSF